MPQTTTDYGKQNISWPDLGYDAGANLHSEIVGSVAKFSDQINTVWSGAQVITASGTYDVTHNFNLSLSSLRVRLVESNAELDIAGEADFAITQVDLNTIRVTNNDSVARTIEIYVAPILRIREGDVDPSLQLGAYELEEITASTTIQPTDGTNTIKNKIFRFASGSNRTITINNIGNFNIENCIFYFEDGFDVTFALINSGNNLTLRGCSFIHGVTGINSEIIFNNSFNQILHYACNYQSNGSVIFENSAGFQSFNSHFNCQNLEASFFNFYNSYVNIENVDANGTTTGNILLQSSDVAIDNFDITNTFPVTLNNRRSNTNINKLLKAANNGLTIDNLESSRLHINNLETQNTVTLFNDDRVTGTGLTSDSNVSYIFIGQNLNSGIDVRRESDTTNIETILAGVQTGISFMGDEKLSPIEISASYQVINITGTTYTIEPNNGANLVENTLFRISGNPDKTLTCNNTSAFEFNNCIFEIKDDSDITFAMTTTGQNIRLSNTTLKHEGFGGQVIINNTVNSLELYNSNIFISQHLRCQVSQQFYIKGGVLRVKTLETPKIFAQDSSLYIDDLILDNTANVTDNEFEQCVVNINTLTQSTALNNYIYFRGSKTNINKLLIDNGSGNRRFYNLENSYMHLTTVQSASPLTIYNGSEILDGATPPDTKTGQTAYLFVGETLRDTVAIRSNIPNAALETMNVGDSAVAYNGDKKLFPLGYKLNDGGSFTLSDSIIKYQLFNFSSGLITLNSGVTEFQNCKFYAETFTLIINNNSGNIAFYNCEFMTDNAYSMQFNMGLANNVAFYGCKFVASGVQTIQIEANKIFLYRCSLKTQNLNINTSLNQGLQVYNSDLNVYNFGYYGTPANTQRLVLDRTNFTGNNITDTATIAWDIEIYNESNLILKNLTFSSTSSTFVLNTNSKGQIAQYTSADTTTTQLTVGSASSNDNAILELGQSVTQARTSVYNLTYYLQNFDLNARMTKNGVLLNKYAYTGASFNTTNNTNISGTPSIDSQIFNYVGGIVHFNIMVTIATASDNTETITNINIPAGFARSFSTNTVIGTIQPSISTSNVSFNGSVVGDTSFGASTRTLKILFYGSATQTSTTYIISGCYENRLSITQRQ